MNASSTILRTSVLVAALCTAIGSAHAQHSAHGHHPPATRPAAAKPTPPRPNASKPATPPVTDPHAHHRTPAEPAATRRPHAVPAAAHQAHGSGHANPAAGNDKRADDPHAQHRGGAEPDTAHDHSAHAGHTGHAGHPESSKPEMPPATDDAHAHHRSEAAQPAGDLPADHPPREPLPPITNADRAAAFPAHLHGHEMHGDAIRSFVRIDRLEAFDGDHGSGQAWEADAWIGGDIDRLWLKASGERSAGRTHAADLDVLYGRSISPWWDVVAGARQSFRPGPSRTLAAIGIQGLAPYMFEVSAMAYSGEGGQVIGELELEYELLLTNRLILQPVIELEVARRDDPIRGIGSGLTRTEAGLRLRYEFARKFAPYIGVVQERAYGDTRDLREAAGEAADDTKFVVGLRTWF